ALTSIKGCYLAFVAVDRPDTVLEFLRALAAVSYRDMCFAAALWAAARGVLALAARWRHGVPVVTHGFVLVSAASCLYVAANIAFFRALGGFLTYRLIGL